MMVKIVLLTILVFTFMNTQAQEDDWRLYRSSKQVSTEGGSLEQETASGKIRYEQDARIQRIDSLKRTNPTPMEGFRVQIFFGERNEAQKVRSDFVRKYPEAGAYVSYLAPNFRLRVGDFRSRSEAEKFKKTILKDFPGCYIVKDQIGLPTLGANSTAQQ